MKTNYRALVKELEKLKDPQRAENSQWYCKTGKGEYGEEDVFLGVSLPLQRQTARKYKDLALSDLQQLLDSKIHEHRQVALIILVAQFKKASEETKKRMVNFYLKNTKRINNWDLVDGSTPHILGEWLLGKDRSILYKLAKSDNLWERRISIMVTFAFIKNNQFEDTFKIAEILLSDKHDLIHKAVGWMLREVGKRDLAAEEKFLQKHYQQMPRTMLRYAIEKFPEKKRKFYLGKKKNFLGQPH